MIRIEINFKDSKKFNNLIRYIEHLDFVRAEAEAYNMAEKTIDNMKKTIEDERIHPARPNLNNIGNALGEPEELVNKPGRELIIGIGNKAILNEKAEYWELINDGGKYITKETHAVPTNFFAGAKTEFITFKAGSEHIIEGIDYVGKAIRNLDKELKEVMIKLGAEFISGMDKASK